jgi:hypothetical protein
VNVLIRKQAVEDYLARELDDWRWMKRLKRETLLEEIKRLHPKPVFQTAPWVHQLVCFWIAVHQPRFLFLLDMGLGKTLISLMVMHYRQRTRELQRGLVFVPRVLNAETWVTAAGQHSDLEPWDCTVESIEEKWDRLMTPRGDFSIIDYQGFALATTLKRKRKGKKGNELVRDDKKVAMVRKLYNFGVLDESHSLKNKDSLWHSLVHQATKEFDFCYGLTGTLFDRDLEEAWAQCYLIDQGETFGPNLGLLRAAFYTTKPDPWRGVQYVFRTDRSRIAARFLRHRSLHYDESEVQELPQRVQRSVKMTMGPEQLTHYMQALQGLINAGGKLQELDAQWVRMRQIVSGYAAWNDEHGNHVVRFKVNPKLDHLIAIIEGAVSTKVVVAYTYTETAAMIGDRLKKEGVEFAWIYGGTKDKPAEKARFMERRECRVLLLNSAAGGTGIDGLQLVSKCMVFYETPTSPSPRQQTLKRIHRPGSTSRVFIWDLVMQRSIDTKILENVLEGRDFYESITQRNGVGVQELCT